MFLENISSPTDVKKLKIEDLKTLADETRAAVINKISNAGGHQGPNLGIVEVTVAFHYVFDSPRDKIVFDVSHQCYPHKILTGRKEAYLDSAHFKDVTGYTNPLESPHDHFTVGHTSTSVSLALGLAYGRDAVGEKYNVVALIGDGSLSGGEALEGLDSAGEYKKNMIIIVNDNEQSIAENHGGLYKSLKALRESNGQSENNIFKAFGLDYRYLDSGHDTTALVELFKSVKDIDHPVVLHIHTTKGKGLKYAEENRERYHAGGPFNVEDGSPKFKGGSEDTTIANCLKNLLDTNPKAIVLNAATPGGLGFFKGVREKYAERGQFIDVGIAEENATAMASGIAKAGGVAVFGTFAPFFQRTYDQMSHDVALNSSPATFLVLQPGAYGMNSNTHTALNDIQFFSNIPNFVYLAPATREEFVAMFNYATTQRKNPVGIRTPRTFMASNAQDTTDYRVLKNKVLRKGRDAAIFAVGSLVPIALAAADKIKEQSGKEITVVNPLFLNGLDTELLDNLSKDHSLIVTIEDGIVDSGYGVNIASYFGDSKIRVKNLGISKAFHTDFDADELLSQNGISAEKLASLILG